MTVEPASTRANRINSDSLDWSYIGISVTVGHSMRARRARGVIPGVVLSRDDGAIVLTFRQRDLDPPSKRSAGAEKQPEDAPQPTAKVIDLAARKAYRRDWKQRFELASRAA